MKHLSNVTLFSRFFRPSPLCAGSRAGALLSVCILACAVLSPDAMAVTDGDLAEEVTKGEKFITGGYMRLGLMAGCGIAGIIAMFKQSVMGLIIAASGALFVFLMKGWIGASFTAVI